MAALLSAIRHVFGGRLSSTAVGGILVVAGAGVAVASVPDSNGLIHGCYNKMSGTLRIIDTATDTCRPSETSVSWNQVGPQGPPGPQGLAGDQGLAVYSVVIGVCGSGSDTQLNVFGGIVGTFSAPVQVGGGGCASATGFRMHRSWSLPDPNAVGQPVLIGSGTASCDPCTVAGRTGSISLSLTVFGLVQFDDSGNVVNIGQLGGSWVVIDASGGLFGLSGTGSYTEIIAGEVGTATVFTGTYSMPS